MATAGLNSRFHIHMFFPRLRRQVNNKWVNFMTNDQYQLMYDFAIIPALQRVCPVDLGEKFPHSYRNAQIKARNSKGTFVFTPKDLAEELALPFFVELRRVIDSTPRLALFRDYFFHVHGKDIKMVLRNTVVSTVREALFNKFDCFEWHKFPETQFWIDVGVEYHPPPETTFVWSLPFVKQYLQSNLNMAQLQLMPWCHSKTLGGGRAVGKVGSRILFCQLYMNEKITYCTFDDGGGIRAFNPQDVKNGSSRFINNINDYLEDLEQTQNKTFSARIEWTVLERDVEIVMQQIDTQSQNLLRSNALYAIPTATAALFRANYVQAVARCMNSIRRWKITEEKKSIAANFVHFAVKTTISSIIKSAIVKGFELKQGRDVNNWYTTSMVDVEARDISTTQHDAIQLATRLGKRKLFQRSDTYSRKRQRNEGLKMMTLSTAVEAIASPQDIFNLFLRSLLELFPSSAVHLRPGQQLQGLTIQEIEEKVIRRYYSKSNESWSTRFQWYFPLTKDELVFTNNTQGWRQLGYWETYFDWISTDASTKRAQLMELFNQLECLPAGRPKEKLWKTCTVKNKQGTRVYFVRNKRL